MKFKNRARARTPMHERAENANRIDLSKNRVMSVTCSR